MIVWRNRTANEVKIMEANKVQLLTAEIQSPPAACYGGWKLVGVLDKIKNDYPFSTGHSTRDEAEKPSVERSLDPQTGQESWCEQEANEMVMNSFRL